MGGIFNFCLFPFSSPQKAHSRKTTKKPTRQKRLSVKYFFLWWTMTWSLKSYLKQLYCFTLTPLWCFICLIHTLRNTSYFKLSALRQLQSPNATGQVFLSFLNIILYQLCTNYYIQGLQAFLLWKPEFPSYLPYTKSPFTFHFSVLPSAVPLQASAPSPQYLSFFLPVTFSTSILQISQHGSR